MRLGTLILLGLVALFVTPAARAADDLDLEGEAAAEPVDWEPMITHFYVRPYFKDVGLPSAKMDRRESLPGVRAAWLAIKPRVAPVAGEIPADQEVVSGWRLDREGSSDNVAPFVAAQTKGEGVETL